MNKTLLKMFKSEDDIRVAFTDMHSWFEFVEMFEELKQSQTLSLSTRSLIEDVAPVEDVCQ